MTDLTAYITALALSMTRIALVFAMFPFASRQWAGRRVVWPVALAVAVLVPAPLAGVPGGPVLLVLVAKEAVVGVGAGLLVARVFHIVAAAGALLDQQAGYTFGASVNPTANISMGPIESLYMTLLTLMLFDGAGAFDLAKGLVATYGSWPVLALTPVRGWSIDALFDHLAGPQGRMLYELLMRLAAPAMALLLLADISMAISARYAQQLNPFSIALALKALVMAIVFGWMLRGQLAAWSRLLHAMAPAP